LKNFLESFLYSSRYNKRTIDILQKSDTQNIFLSTVNLLAGQFFKGLYTNRNSYVTPELIANRIYEVLSPFFNVKIIITIRHQSDWINSAYAEWHNYIPTDVKSLDLEKFYNLFLDQSSNFYSGLDFNYILEVFENKFSKKNVLLLYYETLNEDPVKFYITLLNWIDADYNESILKLIPKKNNRSLPGGKKKLEDSNFLNFTYSLKVKYFPNKRLNLLKNLPFIIKILKSISLPTQSKEIEPLREMMVKIFNCYLKSNEKLRINKCNLPKQYYENPYEKI